MTESSIIMLGIINLIAGIVLWFCFFRTYFFDSYKYELSFLRDKLFDYADKNNVSLEHPAFRDRLDEINGMLNSKHPPLLVMLTCLVTYKHLKREQELYLKLKEDNINTLSDKQKAYFHENEKEQILLFLFYIVKSSIIFIFFSVLFLTICLVIAYLNFLSDIIKTEKKFKSKSRPFANAVIYASHRAA